MHNPRKIVKVSPVLFTSVSQTFDDFCRQKCFTSLCLAKNKQVMATQSKLVCLKLVFVHFSSVIYGFTTGAWGMDFVSSSPLFSTTPPFSKFSYKSFLFQNVHYHSFFLHLTISVDVIHHK